MTRKNTLEKAYGNLPKELPDPFIWTDDWMPRSFRYLWIKYVVRKLFR
jgi:hypothetical protein